MTQQTFAHANLLRICYEVATYRETGVIDFGLNCLLQESVGVDPGHLSCISTRSSVVDELSLSLWHALNVWRCTVQRAGGLESALESLAVCGSQLAFSSWYCQCY